VWILVQRFPNYFIRRNITDQPGTNRLDSIFSGLIDVCQKEVKAKRPISANLVIGLFKKHKTDKPADDNTFRDNLQDELWWYNDGMARYVLCRLDESFRSREYVTDLWKRDEKGRYIWTVEHVLPQTENLRKEWIAMIAGGDAAKARDLQEEWVHCLGNLTLSGYNSKLSDKPFAIKQASHEVTIAGDQLNIGYKNGLELNKLKFKSTKSTKAKEISLATAKAWTIDEIKARNDAIVNRLMKLFKL